MPVYRLMQEMPLSEFLGWSLFYERRAEEEKRGGKPNLLEMDPADIVKGFSR